MDDVVGIGPSNDSLEGGSAVVEEVFDAPFVRLSDQKHSWMTAFFVSLFVIVILAVGFFKLAMTSRSVIHVVEVDALGRVLYSGQAAELDDTEPFIRHELAEFMIDLRTVVRDGEALFRNRARALEHVTGPVRKVIDESFEGEGDPREVSRTSYREVRMQSVLRISERQWQVNWTEIRRFHNTGRQDGLEAWVAFVDTRQSPERVSISNPLGLEITSLVWTPQVNQGGS